MRPSRSMWRLMPGTISSKDSLQKWEKAVSRSFRRLGIVSMASAAITRNGSMSLNHPGLKTPISLIPAYCGWPRANIANRGNNTKRLLKGCWIELQREKGRVKKDECDPYQRASYSDILSGLPNCPTCCCPHQVKTHVVIFSRLDLKDWGGESPQGELLFPVFSVALLSLAAQSFFKYLQKPWSKSDHMLKQSNYERKLTLGGSHLSEYYFSFLSCPR